MTNNTKNTHELTQSEAALLRFTQSHQNAIFAGIISSIASGRLQIPVTETTQFELSDDMSSITITETPDPRTSPASVLSNNK